MTDQDALAQGKKTTWAIYVTERLVAALERDAKKAGFRSTSAFVEALLIAGLRLREAQRIAESNDAKPT